MKIRREYILMFTTWMSAAGALLTVMIFYVAFFFSSNYGVIVLINEYGEAMIEAIFVFPLIFVCAITSSYITYKINSESATHA